MVDSSAHPDSESVISVTTGTSSRMASFRVSKVKFNISSLMGSLPLRSAKPATSLQSIVDVLNEDILYEIAGYLSPEDVSSLCLTVRGRCNIQRET